MNPAQCDIIIPIFNRPDLTQNCLKSILEATDVAYNLILVDNGSDSETSNFLEDFKASNANIVLIRNRENIGWVKAINQGIRISVSPYVCVMNNDTVVKTNGWLSSLIKISEFESDIGLVNPEFAMKNKLESKRPFIEVDFCRGYCVLIKRQVLEKIGLLDESYGLGYYDDDDYSVRAIQAGFRCVRANDVIVEHLRDSTFSTIFDDEKRIALHDRNKMLFYSKWGKRLRLVFIITERKDRKEFSDILFSLARKQHIINVWNMTTQLALAHINIRERIFPSFLHELAFTSILFFNKWKTKSKRYDIVFIDSPSLNPILSKTRRHIYYIDVKKDIGRINEIVDSISRA